MFTRAIAREPGADPAAGITTAGLGAPDHALMLEQHRLYVDTLRGLGVEVEVLDPLPGFPDAHFVEDVAVVLPDLAVIATPGAPARRGEEDAIAPVLARLMRTVRIRPPGTLDGGDVLRAGTHFFVGISSRTNEAGAQQLGLILEEQGYSWTPIPVRKGLHLKSSVSYVSRSTLLVTREFAASVELAGYSLIVLAEGEEYAANSLLVNGTLLLPAGFPDAADKLKAFGATLALLDMSEARKMDGGLSCLSLRF